MKDDEQTRSKREISMRALAQRLEFEVKESDGRFTLIRTVDAPRAVREESLTLDEAEDMLQRWKLRGFHGG
jgi:hypothetical protein